MDDNSGSVPEHVTIVPKDDITVDDIPAADNNLVTSEQLGTVVNTVFATGDPHKQPHIIELLYMI